MTQTPLTKSAAFGFQNLNFQLMISDLAQKNIEILNQYDTVITGCATCSSALKDYGHWFENDDQWKDNAMAVSGKIRDFSEFMAIQEEIVQTIPSAPPITVTNHDPCHLKQHQGVFEAPITILASLPGIENGIRRHKLPTKVLHIAELIRMTS